MPDYPHLKSLWAHTTHPNLGHGVMSTCRIIPILRLKYKPYYLTGLPQLQMWACSWKPHGPQINGHLLKHKCCVYGQERQPIAQLWLTHLYQSSHCLPSTVDVTQTSRQTQTKYLCEDHPRNLYPVLKPDDASAASFRFWYFLLWVALFICPWFLHLVLSSVLSSSCLFLHCLHLFPGLILSCWYLKSLPHTRLLPCPLV